MKETAVVFYALIVLAGAIRWAASPSKSRHRRS